MTDAESDAVPNASEEYKNEYLLEEMKAARNRIDEEIKIINQFEILSISAIFATYYLFLSFKIQIRGQ